MFKKIIIIIGVLVVISFVSISLMKKAYLPYPDFYIKAVCKGKHFSCEQNMSLECRRDGLCIN